MPRGHVVRIGLCTLLALVGGLAGLSRRSAGEWVTAQTDAAARTSEGPADRLIVARSVEPTAQTGAPGGRPPHILNYGLKYEDLDRILARVSTIRKVVPIREFRKEVRRMNDSLDGRIVGTTADYAALIPLEVRKGRFLTAEDHERYENVAVLGAGAARVLFPGEGEDPIGQALKVGTDYYTVVGVLGGREPSAPVDPTGWDPNKDVFLPLNTCKLRFGERILTVDPSGRPRAVEIQLSRLLLELEPGTDLQQAAEAVETILARNRPQGDVEVGIMLRAKTGEP